MQEAGAGGRGGLACAPAIGHQLRGQQIKGVPGASAADHAATGAKDRATGFGGQEHPDGPAALHKDPLYRCLGPHRAAMAFDAPHQGRRHRGTAAEGVIEAGIGFKPLAEQCGHRGGAGVVDLQAGDQEAEELHPVQQEGIAQVATGQRAEGTPQGRQLGCPAQQFQAGATPEGEDAAEAGPQGQKWQGTSGAAEGLDRDQETMPFVRHGGPPQLPQHRQEGIHPHPHPQPTLRQQQIPVVVGHHGHRFPHRPQHLGEGIAGGPAPQATPQGGP